ncbi:methionyl-tRNA formyltransferase, partial [Patescibacteria group bacterium]|nr:methionyl-tRNA formyltransferase [Patescibacteria group bacterium]
MSFTPSDHPFVFFGTPELATVVLDELEAAGLVPTLITTQPDRPRGRGRALAPPPVKIWAHERGIDVLQPENLRDDPALDVLLNSEWSYFVVAAFGMLIPKRLLEHPAHGCLNVHPSLLPKYRGSTPVQSQILADDPSCGVSIILLDEEVDHGPVLAQASISPEEWPLRASVLNGILW